jgi:bacillithiol system protein YtxJ
MVEVINLESLEQWEELKKDIALQGELIIFKYSPVCPISSMVEDDLNSWLQGLPQDYELKCAKLNVVESKEVSVKIADDLKIKHESPQLIWLTKGLHVKWSGSHYDINKNKLKANFNNGSEIKL